MSYAVTMVVQFHPTFVTKSDMAYDVRCFYKERTIKVDAGHIDVGLIDIHIYRTINDMILFFQSTGI